MVHEHPGGDACDDDKKGREHDGLLARPVRTVEQQPRTEAASVTARAIPPLPIARIVPRLHPTDRTHLRSVTGEHMLSVRPHTDELADELRKNSHGTDFT